MSESALSASSRVISPGGWLRVLIGGLLTGLLATTFAVADAAFIFSGSLTRFLPLGIGLALMSTALLALATGFMSSIRGVVALPQEVVVASLAAVAGSVAFALPFAASDTEKWTTIVVSLVLASTATGIFLLLIGTFRLGLLIRFIPVPVVGGFMAGVGCLILFGAFNVATGITPSINAIYAMMKTAALAKALFAASVALAIWAALARLRTPLAILFIVGLATVLFHAIGQITGHSLGELQGDGWFPLTAEANLGWPPLATSDLSAVNWAPVVAQTFTIATMMLMTAIGMIVNISSIEMVDQKDIDIDTELKASGAASAIAGVAGGVAGFHGVSNTLLNLRIAPATRFTGAIVGLVCIATLLTGSHILALVPMPVLGGLLVWVAATLLKQWLIDTYHQLTTGEFAVIVLMTLVLNAAGFVEGLITGLIAGIVLFAIDYSRLDIVKTRLTGETFHSKRVQSDEWRAIMHEHGSQIVILRLQGYIFFGTAHQFVERIRKQVLEKTGIRFLIIDMRRTTGLDTSATVSFAKLEQLAAAERFKLVLTDVPEQVEATLQGAGIGQSALTPVRQFADLNRGMMWCEEKLILRIAPELADVSTVSVKERFVDELFDDEAAQIMLQYMSQLDIAVGDVLIQHGTESKDMYFIESGSFAVELSKGDGQSIRLNTAEPGSFVGEISFYLDQQRSASVICKKPARVWQFSHESLETLRREHPEIASKFHRRMAVLLADRLYATTRLVQQLID